MFWPLSVEKVIVGCCKEVHGGIQLKKPSMEDSRKASSGKCASLPLNGCAYLNLLSKISFDWPSGWYFSIEWPSAKHFGPPSRMKSYPRARPVYGRRKCRQDCGDAGIPPYFEAIYSRWRRVRRRRNYGYYWTGCSRENNVFQKYEL